MSKKRLILASAVLSVATLAASCGGGGGGGTPAAAPTTPPTAPTPPTPPPPTPQVDYVAVFQATDNKIYKVEFTTVGNTKQATIKTTLIGNVTLLDKAETLHQFSNNALLIMDTVNKRLYIVTENDVKPVMSGGTHLIYGGDVIKVNATGKYYRDNKNIIKEDGTVLTTDANNPVFVERTGGMVYSRSNDVVVAVAPDGTQNVLAIVSNLSTGNATTSGNFAIVRATNGDVYVINTETGNCPGNVCAPLFNMTNTIGRVDTVVVGNTLYVAVMDSSTDKKLYYARVDLTTGRVTTVTPDATSDGRDKAAAFAFDAQGNLFYVADNEVNQKDAIAMLPNDGNSVVHIPTNDPYCYTGTGFPTAALDATNTYILPFAGSVLIVDTAQGVSKACQVARSGNNIVTANRNGAGNNDYNTIHNYCNNNAKYVAQRTSNLGCLQANQGFLVINATGIGAGDFSLSSYSKSFSGVYDIKGIGRTIGNNIFAVDNNNIIYRCNPTDTGLCRALFNITKANEPAISLRVDRSKGQVIGSVTNFADRVAFYDFMQDSMQVLAVHNDIYPHPKAIENKVVGTPGVHGTTSCTANIIQVWKDGSVLNYTPTNDSSAIGSGICVKKFIGFVK